MISAKELKLVLHDIAEADADVDADANADIQSQVDLDADFARSLLLEEEEQQRHQSRMMQHPHQQQQHRQQQQRGQGPRYPSQPDAFSTATGELPYEARVRRNRPSNPSQNQDQNQNQIYNQGQNTGYSSTQNQGQGQGQYHETSYRESQEERMQRDYGDNVNAGPGMYGVEEKLEKLAEGECISDSRIQRLRLRLREVQRSHNRPPRPRSLNLAPSPLVTVDERVGDVQTPKKNSLLTK